MNWSTDEPRPEPSADEGRRTRVLEDVFILLCILSLWPVILGWRHVAYQVLLYVALASLIFILVRRVRRFARAREEAEARR